MSELFPNRLGRHKKWQNILSDLAGNMSCASLTVLTLPNVGCEFLLTREIVLVDDCTFGLSSENGLACLTRQHQLSSKVQMCI